jgi:hypothetical protein
MTAPAPVAGTDPDAEAWRASPPKPAATTQARPSTGGSPRRAARRTRVIVRKLGPLSVLKFSLLFYLCVMLIVYLALLIIWVVLSAAGGVEALGRMLGWIFGSGDSTAGRTPVEIDGQQLFTWLFVGGVAFAFVWSLINVFVAFLYNLISDLVGGIEITLAEKPPR